MATTNTRICFLLLLISPCLSATNILFSDIGDGILHTGESLLYKGYNLYMQPDCNLCLYAPGERWPDWYTNTAPRGINCQLKLQSDGELLLSGHPRYYPSGRTVFWRNHNTSTEGCYALVLNYDGSLRVYGPPIWSMPNSLKVKSTSTDHSSSLLPSTPSTIDSTFWTGDIAPIGTTIANGDYKLELHGNCNLTLSNDRTKETLWYTNTKDPYDLYDCFVSLQDNGELRIKYVGGDILWTSGSKGRSNSGYVLALRPDGNLAIYGPPIWEVNVKKTGDVAVADTYGEKIAMVTEE